jgi:hypothetical protein
LFNTLGSQTTPYTLLVEPALSDSTTSSLSNAVDYPYAVVGVQETLTFWAKDAYYNLQIHQTDVITATLVDQNPSDPANPATVTGTVTATANGIYQIQYKLLQASTHYALSITLSAYNTALSPPAHGPPEQIAGSPFTVVCQVSTTAPANTVITPATQTAIAGHMTQFVVTLYDTGNNQRTSGGDQLVIGPCTSLPLSASCLSLSVSQPMPTLTPDTTSGGQVAVTAIEIFDQGDGTYVVGYVATDTSSLFTVSVTVNQDTDETKTITGYLTVESDITSPSSSTITWTSWTSPDPIKIVDLTTSYSFSTFLKDLYMNPIKERW